MLHRELLAGKYGYIDSFLIVRHQKIVFEQYFSHDYAAIYGEEARTPGPLVINDPSGSYNYFNAFWHPFYKGTTLHTLQSVTKSVVSLTLGMAIARGDLPSLDTPVLSFFDASAVANVDDRKRRMTLRHLLNMSTGLEWDERLPYSDPANTFTIMAKSLDWVRYTLDAPMASEPGTVFNYNSGATLVLGHIFRVATGTDIEEYALRHLLEPLGIEDYYWDRTPSGLADAQEGLYLSTRDLARIMLLVHQRGRWQGRQLIPEAWLQESFSPQFSTAAEGDEAFGLSWWSESYQYRGESRRALFGKGFGGQRPIVLPDLDTIIVVTGWNILPGQPFLTEAIAIEAVTSAMHH
ncbi:MAG: serine hydrolase [Halieaceae bacterium]